MTPIRPPRPALGFDRHGPARPSLPVVLAVPHAGRDYGPELIAAAAAPERLGQLEDRHADALVAEAIAAGAPALIARRPRAWIDLNRDPREMDAGMIDGPIPGGLFPSARTRAGLGLIPRRIGNGPELWRRKIDAADLAARIAEDHAPWHAEIGALLAAARAAHGVAILLDCHSMPPLVPDAEGRRDRVVIGDRYGRSATEALVERVEASVRGAGLSVARNRPYAGGYGLERHARPEQGIHAIQIEIDRSLYLDPALDRPGPGLRAMQKLMRRIVLDLAEAATAGFGLAAE